MDGADRWEVAMGVMVVDERKVPVREPYVIRMGGWTLERYLREAPEDRIWEFVRGEVLMHSPATAEHQDLVGFLYWLLRGYCEARGWGKVLMGPAAVRVLPDVVREPDVFVIRPEEVGRARGVPLEVVPALVVEVVSPSTRTLDLWEKAEEYARAGVEEYWGVDGEERVLWVHRRQGDRYAVEGVRAGRVASIAVPGFWLEVGWLFQTPLPPVTECLRAILGAPGT
jgi:Uma2 family endonuclease